MKNIFNDLSIESGINGKEFHVIYQPIFDENHNVVGAEALARWLKDGKKYHLKYLLLLLKMKGKLIF